MMEVRSTFLANVFSERRGSLTQNRRNFHSCFGDFLLLGHGFGHGVALSVTVAYVSTSANV